MMTPIGCWRLTRTPTQQEVVGGGSNETTPLRRIHEGERESEKGD